MTTLVHPVSASAPATVGMALTQKAFPKVRTNVAKAVLRTAVSGMPITVKTPDTMVHDGGPDVPTLIIHRPEQFYARLGSEAKIGFGEAYMDGDWACAPGSDLADLLLPFARRMSTLVPQPVQRLRRLVERAQPAETENTLQNSKSNIAAHYDLSNDFFALFLDESMTYSSAWFAESSLRDGDLAAGQIHKLEKILDLAGVKEGSRVLEIGTGWGSLALRAAARGAQVVTLTISAAQAEVARDRINAAGAEGTVEVVLRDYREMDPQLHGLFDAIVSVEMIEAVGEQYWPAYFIMIDEMLAPGGRVAIQAITMDHERLLATKNAYSWIQKYIFPGGLIPSHQAISDSLAAHTSLGVTVEIELRQHYAETLRQWRMRFLDNWDRIEALGFDEKFRRMWEFYLAYCEAGFSSGYLGVSQIQISRS